MIEPWGEYPMADAPWYGLFYSMKHNHCSLDRNQKTAIVLPPAPAADSTLNEINYAPSPNEVAQRAYFSYVNGGAQHGHDVEHWLQAEALLRTEHKRTQNLTPSPTGPVAPAIPDGDKNDTGRNDQAKPVQAVVTDVSGHDFHRNDSQPKTPGVPVRPPLPKPDLKPAAGLWIDHRKAVIAIVSAGGKETLLEIHSNVEKQPGRFAGVRSTAPYESQQVKADDSHEREFTGDLHKFYAEVIAALRGVEFILLFGPGEAKEELKKRLEQEKGGRRFITLETADKMTDRQISAKVRDHFYK
jgi:hypothetical protein